MPARDIKLGDTTLHVHSRHVSEHSDAEYDELRSQNESLTMQIEDSREDFYELQAKYDKLREEYDEELLDELMQLECEDEQRDWES